MLAATVLGSGIAFLDSTVVNVALPHIGEDLDTGVGGLQWVLNGYLVAVSSLILLGGSLGDLFGRKRIFQIGVLVFAAGSLLCAVAPTALTLVLARAVQGVGGALLTPGSLAILEASFRPDDRSRAIGAWSGLGGVASAIGPFVGGWLVDAASWRWIFLIDLPLSIAVLAVAARHVPESSNPDASRHVDGLGAALIALSLGGLSYGLIAAGDEGWVRSACGDRSSSACSPSARSSWSSGAAGTRCCPRRSSPRRSSGRRTWSPRRSTRPWAASSSCWWCSCRTCSATRRSRPARPASPSRSSCWRCRPGRALAARIGPRLQMTVGPLLVAVGTLLMTRIDAGATYVDAVLPAVLVMGLGLATTVAPLTSTALSAVADRYAGVASGVNTTVARAAQLAAVAALPLAAGITGETYLDPQALSDGFQTAMVITSVFAAAGGVIAFFSIRNPARVPEVEPVPEVATRWFCGAEGPPLDTCPRSEPAGGDRAA